MSFNYVTLTAEVLEELAAALACQTLALVPWQDELANFSIYTNERIDHKGPSLKISLTKQHTALVIL